MFHVLGRYFTNRKSFENNSPVQLHYDPVHWAHSTAGMSGILKRCATGEEGRVVSPKGLELGILLGESRNIIQRVINFKYGVEI